MIRHGPRYAGAVLLRAGGSFAGQARPAGGRAERYARMRLIIWLPLRCDFRAAGGNAYL